MTRAVKKVTEVTEVILVIKDANDSDTNDYENVSGWMKYEKNRRDSFDPIWLEHYQLNATFAHELAEAGFYCVPEGGDSVCFSCGLRKSSFFWGGRGGTAAIRTRFIVRKVLTVNLLPVTATMYLSAANNKTTSSSLSKLAGNRTPDQQRSHSSRNAPSTNQNPGDGLPLLT